MTFNLLSFRNELQKKGVFFGFSGPLTQDLLAEIGEILKQKMKLRDASSPTILKVFSLVVELTQNIIHYSAENALFSQQSQDLRTGMIAVGFDEGAYFVSCGNLIESRDVERLRSMIEQVNHLNSEELKHYYREQRRRGPDQQSKGAGLGFIEMARKSCRPLEYHFEPIDDHYSFFSVNAYI